MSLIDKKVDAIARILLSETPVDLVTAREDLKRLLKTEEDNLPDSVTLDGLKPYGVMESKISLVTLDFYRANVEIFDKYKPDDWWWLATPESAQPHDNPWWILCVSPSGYFGLSDYGGGIGGRPFCIFDSSIFESCEEVNG